jgi:hypothetical protein
MQGSGGSKAERPVLLVEPDPLLAYLFRTTIEDLGRNVCVPLRPDLADVRVDYALAVLGTPGDDPRISKLAAELRSLHPGLPMILVGPPDSIPPPGMVLLPRREASAELRPRAGELLELPLEASGGPSPQQRI